MKFETQSLFPRKNLLSQSFAREWSSLQKNMTDLMSGFERLFSENSLEPSMMIPKCGIQETDNQYLLNFDLPGVSKDDIKIEVVGNTLRVSGERKLEHHEKKGGYKTEERYHGTFAREFELPDEIDPNRVEASFQDGVLKLCVPRTEAAKVARVPINDGKTQVSRPSVGGARQPEAKNAAKSAA